MFHNQGVIPLRIGLGQQSQGIGQGFLIAGAPGRNRQDKTVISDTFGSHPPGLKRGFVFQPHGHFSQRRGALEKRGIRAKRHLVGRQAVRIIAHLEHGHIGIIESLEQALIHLVQNAIDASKPGVPVMVDQRREQGSVIIEVADSGAGMSPEFIRTHLFKPFHSSKPGGFGIGAFEARELIRAMGGRLDVESREGLGTRFRIRLPTGEAAQLMRAINDSRTHAA